MPKLAKLTKLIKLPKFRKLVNFAKLTNLAKLTKLTILANWLFGSVSVFVREVFKKSKLTKAQ